MLYIYVFARQPTFNPSRFDKSNCRSLRIKIKTRRFVFSLKISDERDRTFYPKIPFPESVNLVIKPRQTTTGPVSLLG